jgi:hypothetical protein
MSSRCGAAAAVQGGIERGAVLPAAPDDPQPGAGQDPDGGFLYGTATVSNKTGAVTNGKVTGGTGSFKGATGTIKAKALNKSGTRHAVTITYST